MKIRRICLYGILGALTFVLKLIMAPLPNIEPVSLLFIIYAITFHWQALFPMFVYVMLEIMMYGVGIWSVGYLYIWFVLIVITIYVHKITKSTNIFLWALVSGIYGVLVGLLYVPIYVITGGITIAYSWWISGIPYDITHGVANFILCIVLFKPLLAVLSKLETIQN